MEFKYTKLTQEFEKALFVDAWEAAFSRKYDQAMYDWLYTNRNNMYAVYDGDKIIAGYCLLNQKMIFNGEMIDGALCNNVFVRPDYQGLQLFTKLGQYSIEKAGEQGKKLLIGIPNKNAVPGHRKVGWTFQNEINFLEKNTTSSSAPKSDDKVVVVDTENFAIYQDRLEKFSIEISSPRTFSVIKEKDYFKWRYLERPLVNYKIFMYVENDNILGYIVYKLYEPGKRLHIIDVEATNEEVFLALLNASEGIEGSFNLVNTWDSSIYKEYFLHAGFAPSEEFNSLIAIKPLNSDPILLGDKVNIVLSDNEVF